MPRRTLLVSCLAALALAGCGQGEPGDDPDGLVPPGASVYADVTLDPEGSQAEAVDAIVKRFPGGDGGPRALIERALESSHADLSYEEDLEPWLGDRAVLFVSGFRGEKPQGGAIVATTDSDKARDFMEKAEKADAAEKKGHFVIESGLRGEIVENHLVVATDSGIAAIKRAADDGRSLGDDERFRNALAELSEDRLATAYFDFRKLIQSSGAAVGPAEALLGFYRDPLSFALVAEDDAVVVESALPDSLSSFVAPFLGAGTEVVGGLPAGSWFATGSPELGKQLLSSLELFAGVPGATEMLEKQLRGATGLSVDGLIGWMGDAGFFARGTSLQDLGVGVVIETKDPSASRRAIEALGNLIRGEAGSEGVRVGPLTLSGGGPGFSVTSAELPGPVHVTQRGRRVVAALGDAATREALAPSRTLADEAAFTDAVGRLGEGYQASSYVDIASILAFAENLGASADESYNEAKPYLEVFERIVAGAEGGDGPITSRLRIELR